MTPSPRALLISLLRARTNEPGLAWLDRHTAGDDPGALCAAYTAAPKHVGRERLSPSESERRALIAASDVSLDRWTIDDVARAILLLSAAERLDHDAFFRLATDCLERGDAREQQSWLRAISLLPAPERFQALAIEACRTNIVPVFEAIACENPFPARHFSEPQFNQLVLKALFNSIMLSRIVGLRARVNAALSRMASDYAAERRAAGRTVPADIAMAMIGGGAPQELSR